MLLLPTTTYKAHDFLAAAGRLGIETVVGSEHRQALEDLAPGRSVTLDLRRPERAAAQIARYARGRPLDAIIPTDDETAEVAAAASRRLGLPHNPPRAAHAARHKDLMRRLLRAAGVPAPRHRVLHLPPPPRAAHGSGAPRGPATPRGPGADERRRALEDLLARAAARQTYPCVLKPTFLAASRGVIRADSRRQFVAAGRRIARLLADPEISAKGGAAARRLLVEEYVPGAEVALEGLLVRGRLRTLALFDKPEPMEGPYFEETIYVTPSRLPPGTRRAIERVTARAARALGLRDGPVHAELRLDPRPPHSRAPGPHSPEARGPDLPGPAASPRDPRRTDTPPRPCVLEVAARSIGGLCARTLRFGTGLSLEEVLLLHATRRGAAALRRETRAAGVMMIPIPRRGMLHEIHGLAAARRVPGIAEITITAARRRPIIPLPEGSSYLGFIFARGRTPAAVEAALRAAHRRLHIVIA